MVGEVGMRRSLFLPLLLVAVGSVVYLNSLDNPFVFDDQGAIVENEFVRRLWPPWSPKHDGENYSTDARPIPHVSLALNYAIGGLEPRGYHVVNLAVHILCSLALFGVVRRTLLGEGIPERFARSADGLAFASALLWLVHPIQSQIVNYVAQRTESLMGLFYFLTLYAAIRAIEKDRRTLWTALAIGACACGMASKQIMVTAPVVVMIYDQAYLAGSFREILQRRWKLYCGLAGTWLVLLGLMHAFPDSSVGLDAGVTPYNYAKHQCFVILHYLRLFVWPHPLALDYGAPHTANLPLREVLWEALVLVGLVAASAVALFRRPRLGFLATWFFVVLAPTSSFIAITPEIGAERRVYVSLAGLVVLAVILGAHAFERFVPLYRLEGKKKAKREVLDTAARNLRVGTVVVLAAALAWATVLRNRDYRDPITIWQSTIEAMPGNFRAHNNLGAALRMAERNEEAIAEFRKSAALRPIFARAHYNLGEALEAQGKTVEASAAFKEALLRDPSHIDSREHLAVGLAKRGQFAEAIVQYGELVRLEPGSASVHGNFGNVLLSSKKFDQAKREYQEALRLDSNYLNAKSGMGHVNQALKNYPASIRYYREVLIANPDIPEIQMSLASVLDMTGELDEALDHYRKAVGLRPGWRLPLERIARVLATRPGSTPNDLEEALRIAEALGDSDLIEQLKNERTVK